MKHARPGRKENAMIASGRIQQAGALIGSRGKRMSAAALAGLLLMGSLAAAAQSGGRSGKEVVDTGCVACHGTGANGAPKIGDRKAWSKRAAQGLSSLTEHALSGIRQMPAHGGNPGLSDLEIGRAVAYMVNQSGGHWVEPVAATDLAAERSGEQVVKAQCVKCHQAGLNGAPKIGDSNAWIPRLKQGVDYLVRSAIRGHGGMPPRGGQANLTDGEIRSAILYMYNPGKPTGGGTPKASGAADAAVTKAGPNHKSVGGMEIYLGFMPAKALLSFPKESVERSMHGGVPVGAEYIHLNVSLVDAKTEAPVNDARVEVQIEEPGVTSASKTLEPMGVGGASYGNYVRMKPKTSYLITVRVHAPSWPRGVEARFEHSTD
jgi:cytochrome c5